MTSAEKDVIRAECEEWVGALLYLDSNETRAELRDRVCANPDAWWRVLQDLITQAPDDQNVQRLAYAPLRMTLECGGERLLREALPPEVYGRIEAAAGIPLERRPTPQEF